MKITEIRSKFPKVFESLEGDEVELRKWLQVYNRKRKIANLKKRIKSKRKRKKIYDENN